MKGKSYSMIKVLKILVVLFIIFLFVYMGIFRKNKEKSPSADASFKKEESEIHMEDMRLKLDINGQEWIALLENNTSAQALVEKLKEGPISVSMEDYANFEKVGDLGFTLPTNDEDISTQAGDLILYQGRSFVIYYDTNHWRLTRLGRIEGASKENMKKVLGSGSITVTLSLK